MHNFTPDTALIGGLLIGIAASLLLWLNGQIAGISGIFRGAIRMGQSDRLWRLWFLIGLAIGGALWWHVAGEQFFIREDFPLPVLIAAGVLVGFGSRVGNGCTSGHGVCGIGRVSGRSLASTVTFFSVALATTYLVRHVLGGFA